MNFFSHSSSSTCTNYTMSTKLHQQPTTSSQPHIANLDIQETFSGFTLNGTDASPITPTRINDTLVFDDDNFDDGYSTPTNTGIEYSYVPEERWVYSTPTKARSEPVCPGAPKRNNTRDIVFGSSSLFSQSLPTDSPLAKRGITKQKKYRKTSPSANFPRRRSFPNIRLDFNDIEISDEGQNTN